MRKSEVQTDNSALSQIFTSKDLSDLYARRHHKLAEFEGMSIKHRAGRKLYCAHALSRRRHVKGDDAQPFCVEPGVPYTLTCDQEVSPGGLHTHTYTHTQAHDSTHMHASNTHTHTHTCALCKNIFARTHTRPHTPTPEDESASEEATPFNMHSDWSLELLQKSGHQFVIKVASTAGENSRQDPQQVCGVSGAYECQHLESASLKQWRKMVAAGARFCLL